MKLWDYIQECQVLLILKEKWKFYVTCYKARYRPNLYTSNSVQVWFGIQIMNHECTIINYIDLNVNVTYVKTYDLKSD